MLSKDIEAALQRGCEGRLITSTYQNFTDIESLRFFLRLQKDYAQFECHLDDDCFFDAKNYSVNGFHTKGYIFTYGNMVEMIVGSSNITRYALLKNVEWDLLLEENKENSVYRAMMKEFDFLWNQTYELDEEHICSYTRKLNYAIERWDMDYDIANSLIKPNYMQRNALKELNRYRAMGIARAMVVCSAGSGKTYLSAFDALNFNPDKLLYIVHESSILKKAMETYQAVFGTSVKCGLYTGESKDINADFLFSTNISMVQNLNLFKRDEFSYIVVDECHHSTAESYKKIIEYFQPEFLLGLTATPERMDHQDVFSLFDGNVPYELRLRDAIINDLVVPFHYFGIRDSFVDYGLSKSEERRMFAEIADASHCEFVMKEIEKHRQPGKLKALAFCRNVTHARQMSEALGEYYHTAYLTGTNSTGERIRAYEELQSDEEDSLEILCSVDILNEGVDIPGVNMVLFLRPTESSTVFIQQLGRGLRKYANKSFVTVLDFIGNSYKRSVQIAFALGSLSENLILEKRLMQSLVRDDFSAVGLKNYGVEIHIDEESKEEILTYIESENFNSLSYMKQDYLNFKKYIDCDSYPRHMDYLNNDCAPDLMRFMSIKIGGKKTSCYYEFLQGIGETGLPIFTEEQVKFLKKLSALLPLVRTEEYGIVSALLEGNLTKEDLYQKIQPSNKAVFEHALHYMKKDTLIREEEGVITLKTETDYEFMTHVKDLLEYGLTRYEADYTGHQEPFLLWTSYQKSQVQRKLLKNPSDMMLGTYTYGDVVVIFASLKKDASIEERLNYKDKYLTPSVFQWESRNHLSQKEYEGLLNSKFAYVFVRKVEQEHGIQLPFTYVGKGVLTNPRRQDTNQTCLFDIQMEDELPDYLQYDYGLSDEWGKKS